MFKITITFQYDFFRSIRGYLHLVTLILGLIIVVVGWHAYYNSECTSIYKDLKQLMNGTTITIIGNGDNIADMHEKTLHLPNLIKEQFFLGISMATFWISLLLYLTYLLGLQDRHQSVETLLSILYHLSGAVALIVVGGLLMLSAVKIDEFYEELRRHDIFSEFIGAETKIQLYSEKISAGVISVLNGIIFGVIAAASRSETLPKKKKVRVFQKHAEVSFKQ